MIIDSIQLERKQKDFCFSDAFSLWIHLIVLSLFHALSLKGIIKRKTKATAFSNQDYNASKNIFAFCDCLSFTHSLLCLVSLFHAPRLKGIMKRKTKPTAFFNHHYNASKNIFAFYDFLFFSLTIVLCHSFRAPSLKGIIKQGRLKPLLSLTMARMQAKIFLLFFNCLSFLHPILCSVSHAPKSKARRKLNSLLLL